MNRPFFQSDDSHWMLECGNCITVMKRFAERGFQFDCAFADPPYFLSNGGISVHGGRQVCVNKGDWDKSRGNQADMEFTRNWLMALKRILKPSGSVWVSGTHHNTFQVANALVELGFKILNVIVWQKTNPPPNLACRCFTHSTEFVIWARREENTPHYFNYNLMRRLAGGKQMKDVWAFPTIGTWEKSFGKHPTQKPLALLVRILLASTRAGDWIIDPFAGACTTGIATKLLNRSFVGIDKIDAFLSLGIKRYGEAETETFQQTACRHIADLEKAISCEK